MTQARKENPMQMTEKRIEARLSTDGPADEIDASASYTFEACIDGRWYRWIGQRPVIEGDRCRFLLCDGSPIEPPVV